MASSAITALVAATAATAWPSYKVLSLAITFLARSRKLTGVSPAACHTGGGAGGKSLPVTTALTPGRAAAFSVLIDRILAWACGLRSTRPISIPGKCKSAPNFARPVTLSTPSGRIGRFPIHLNSWLSLPISTLLSCLPRHP